MIDAAKVALYIPPGLRPFKQNLFDRIARHIKTKGGRVIRAQPELLDALSSDIIPIVGCQPESTDLIIKWRATKRPWIYWDRGYARRVFATWLPRGQDGGYYRWIVGGFQMREIRKVPSDRWNSLGLSIESWAKSGRHIVIACPTDTYARFHRIEGWTDRTIRELSTLTTRQLVVRDKETKRPLQDDLNGAHCIVGHGTNALVEAALMGCPVFCDQSSAAALVGRTDLRQIENPLYPDRTLWAASLAYGQFNESELIDGTLFSLLH